MLVMIFFASKTDFGKKIYCETIYRIKTKTFEHETDTFCENYEELDLSRVVYINKINEVRK